VAAHESITETPTPNQNTNRSLYGGDLSDRVSGVRLGSRANRYLLGMSRKSHVTYLLDDYFAGR
jgi:hypothetical protein